MAESTLEAPPVPEPSAADQMPVVDPVPWTLRKFMREHPGWSTGVFLFLISTVLVVWARTRPSYDAYGFLVWGYQTLHLSLDLGGAPSWKPLPYLFTVPFAVIGHYQLWLWMITVVAVSLAGAVFGGRIAYRLVGGFDAPDRRTAAWVAAIVAGVAVLGLEDYAHYMLSSQTDPMIVTFCLAAIDCHLGGRHRWAVALGVLAALGRPEVWPFLGLYGILLWRQQPSMRWFLIGGAVVVLFMWFGIPTITNHRPFVSAQLALKSPRSLHSNKVVGTINRFTELQYLPVWLAALFTLAVAAVRRNWLLLALAGGALAWVVVEIAFALHGWPALPRYMFEPAAVGGVFAGVAVGWILVEAPRLRAGMPRWAGIPIVVVLVGALVPGAIARLRNERKDLRHERGRTGQIGLLQTTTTALGGARHIRNCGQPVTDVTYVSAMAWLYHLNVGSVGGLQQHVEVIELRKPLPKVLFKPLSGGGWRVQPWHTRPSQVVRCAGLKAAYARTAGHPGGVLLRGH